MASPTRQTPQSERDRRVRQITVSSPPSASGGSRLVFMVPALAALVLYLVSWHPRIQRNEILVWSFWAATASILIWTGALYLRARATSTGRSFQYPAPRPEHYVQAILHISLFVYWGYFWRPVYDYALLLVSQVIFAFAVDILLSWSRRDNYRLGFGPIPIVFSTNLFLWFRDDWFYLQFLMIAVGFLGKEFVRWKKDGRLVHIFNPSAFSLSCFSIILIASGSTDLTWGREIASTMTFAPWIYTFLFVVGLVDMYLFSITLVTGAAAATLFGLSGLYFSITGVPYFLDSEIPIAVFLGLHLLVTDPSTSPRTPPGKLLFGILYGAGVFALYTLLDVFGAPTFYDKLLCVPLLNLSIKWIDEVVGGLDSAPILRYLALDGTRRANYAHMVMWTALFIAMTAMGKTDGRHTGDSLPFWQQACEEGRTNACGRLMMLERTYCGDGAGWACNELGRQYVEGRLVAADADLARGYFGRACELRFQAGCLNLLDPGGLASAPPRTFDLRLLLRERGANLMEMPEPELYARACGHGWTFACQG